MNNISKLTVFIGGFFLNLGLISCGPDDKIPAPAFRITPPTVVTRSGDTISWVALGKKADQVHTLHDELNFSKESSGYQLKIKSFCSQNNHLTRSETAWQNPKKIKLIQILPLAFLLQNQPEDALCRLEFTAQSQNGSKHLFQWNNLAVQNHPSGSGLKITRNQQPLNEGDINMIVAEQWSQFELTDVLPQRTLQLECENYFWSVPVKFEQSFSFSAIDVKNFKARDLNKNPFSSLSPGLCRFVVNNGGEREAISPLFHLLTPVGGPEVMTEFNPKFNLTSPNNLLAKVTIKNPYNQSLYLQLQNYPRATALGYLLQKANGKEKLSRRHLEIFIDLKTPPYKVHQQGERKIIELRSQQELVFVVQGRRFFCFSNKHYRHGTNASAGFLLPTKQNLFLLVSAPSKGVSSEILANYSWLQGPRFIGSTLPLVKQKKLLGEIELALKQPVTSSCE